MQCLIQKISKVHPITDKTKMKPYQERVITEKSELDDKIRLLSAFLEDVTKVEAVTMEERHRMTTQLYAMRSYSEALNQRILHFSA